MTNKIPLTAFATAITIHILWGGNPVAAKFGMLAVPPLWSALIRFVIGIVFIAAWAKLNGVRVWPHRGEWSILLKLGALFTVQIGAMNIGFDNTSGAMAAILISTNPVFAALFAHFMIAGDRLSAIKAFGLLIAFSGVVLVLVNDGALADLSLANWGNWAVLFSAFLLGLRLVQSARSVRSIDPVRVAVWQMMVSLPLFAAGGLLFEQIDWPAIDWRVIAGLLYQGVIIAGIGFLVTFELMKRYRPSVMMSFNFLAPVSGVLLSAWLLKESVGLLVIVGVALVALGLLLIAKSE